MPIKATQSEATIARRAQLAAATKTVPHRAAHVARAKDQVAPDTFTPAGARGAVADKAAKAVEPIGNVNQNDPTLKTLADGTLRKGKTGYCVKATLDNMSRLGVAHPAATGADRGNNPRGGMVQLMNKNGFKSLSTPGSTTQTIKSPYGTVQASVIPAAEYDKLARAGKIPSGAVVFQTRHDSWNSTSKGSHGFDMGIARDGGRTTFNYADMHKPLVYGARTQSVVVLVPGSAVP